MSAGGATRHRFQWYEALHRRTPEILDEARTARRDLGLEHLDGEIGLYPGSSSTPGPLPGYVLDAIVAANQPGRIRSMRELGDELRELVKDVFGDDYDVAVTNTCESGLRVAFETLMAPPTLRKGEAYRSRYVTLYGEDLGFLTGYGRPFPPRYKNLLVDRSGSAGEVAVEGKSLPNLDSVVVRFPDVKYQAHGIRYNAVPFLTGADAAATARALEKAAERHASELSGFASIAYDTPGYGNGQKDPDGVPTLLRLIGELARIYDVPFLVDAASCVPILGLGPQDVGADVMVWSMDKACRAPTCGLVIGREESMVPIRKALGVGGARHGGTSSHGKAAFSFADPGPDTVVGLLAVVRALRDRPDLMRATVDDLHGILAEEIERFEPARFLGDLMVTPSHTMGGIEVNYENTWKDDAFGVPLFSTEDLFGNTNPIMSAMEEMGVHPATIYSGNIFVAPGMGTLDRDGTLMEQPTRLAVRAMLRSIEIVCRHAGLAG